MFDCRVHGVQQAQRGYRARSGIFMQIQIIIQQKYGWLQLCWVFSLLHMARLVHELHSAIFAIAASHSQHGSRPIWCRICVWLTFWDSLTFLFTTWSDFVIFTMSMSLVSWRLARPIVSCMSCCPHRGCIVVGGNSCSVKLSSVLVQWIKKAFHQSDIRERSEMLCVKRWFSILFVYCARTNLWNTS